MSAPREQPAAVATARTARTAVAGRRKSTGMGPRALLRWHGADSGTAAAPDRGHRLPCWTPSRRPRRNTGVAHVHAGDRAHRRVDGLPLRVSAGLGPDFPCMGVSNAAVIMHVDGRHVSQGRSRMRGSSERRPGAVRAACSKFTPAFTPFATLAPAPRQAPMRSTRWRLSDRPHSRAAGAVAAGPSPEGNAPERRVGMRTGGAGHRAGGGGRRPGAGRPTLRNPEFKMRPSAGDPAPRHWRHKVSTTDGETLMSENFAHRPDPHFALPPAAVRHPVRLDDPAPARPRPACVRGWAPCSVRSSPRGPSPRWSPASSRSVPPPPSPA